MAAKGNANGTVVVLAVLSIIVLIGTFVVAYTHVQTSDAVARIDSRLDVIYSDVGTMKADVAVLTEKIARIEPIINRIDQKVAAIGATTKGISAYMVNRQAKDYSQKGFANLVRELPEGLEIVILPKGKSLKELSATSFPPGYTKKYKFLKPLEKGVIDVSTWLYPPVGPTLEKGTGK